MKIGIIGAGYWGKKLIGEYKELDVELIVCDLVVPDTIKDYKNLKVDAVHIATPNETHYEIAKYFLENGVHVLLEKPMALNSAEAWKLVELAEYNNLILQVGHIFRFDNSVRKIKELIKNNELGDINYVKMQWTTMLDPHPDEHIIWDLAPHPIDILNFIFGEWATDNNAVITQSDKWALILIEYPSFFASIELSWVDYWRKTRSITINGSKGMVDVNLMDQTMFIGKKEQGKMESIEPGNTIKEEITNFINAVKNKDRSLNSGVFGAKTVETLEELVK